MDFFKLKENGTTVKTEIIAGITTFMTMAYILAVNPDILSAAGMNRQGVFVATILASVIGCVVMGLLANYPFALAPGMGLNAFFAYTIVIGMGYSWQYALAAVFVEGIIFIILTVCNVREALFNAIPDCIKYSMSTGIGLFIAFVGLKNAGVVDDNFTGQVLLTLYTTSRDQLTEATLKQIIRMATTASATGYIVHTVDQNNYGVIGITKYSDQVSTDFQVDAVKLNGYAASGYVSFMIGEIITLTDKVVAIY